VFSRYSLQTRDVREIERQKVQSERGRAVGYRLEEV